MSNENTKSTKINTTSMCKHYTTVAFNTVDNYLSHNAGFVRGWGLIGDIADSYYRPDTHTTTVLQPFSGTIWVSRCQKRTSGLYGARED